jgi:hypothetical protein
MKRIIAKLFGEKQQGQQTTTGAGQRQPVTNRDNLNRGENWYLAYDKSRNLRQLVLLSDPDSKAASRFETFFFATAYSDLVNHPIVAGFFRLGNDPGPFLLLRTDGSRDDGYEAVEEMAKHPFRIAFNFAHMPTSGIMSIFVCSSFLKAYSQRGFLEMHYGLDLDNTRNLVSDAFQKDKIQIVHARGIDGAMLPTAKYDLEIPIYSECRQALADEWQSLLSHHAQIARPNFQLAVERLYQMFPGASDPIMQ